MPGLTIDTPITFTRACTGINVIPGDVIKLRAGTYSADYVSKINGTSGSRVTVKAYEGERVIINGNWNDQAASYVDYIDLEFTATLGNRSPSQLPNYLPSPDIRGTGNRVINCILHDTYLFGAWYAVDEVYGCVSYNHGFKAGGSGYGHSLYTQNNVDAHKKTIKHNIFGRSANYGLHGYAEAYYLANIDIIENVLLPGVHHIIGSQNDDRDITFSGNHLCGYGDAAVIGYFNDTHSNLTMQNNILYSELYFPLVFKRWSSGDISNNKFINSADGGEILNYKPAASTTMTVDNNSYYVRSGKSNCFTTDGVAPYWMNIATWRSLYGFDANSTITLDGTTPADSVTVYPNEYASISRRKGLVVIWNWTQAATVDVDLSSLSVDAGGSYKLLQAQDPLGDQRAFTMPANKIVTVTMSGTIASVSGWPDPPTTFPMFGAFVVETS